MISRRALLGWPATAVAAAAWPRIALAERNDFASPWSEASHSAIRLIDGGRAGSVALAGLQMRMRPGFKTYWRDPGDSGVPPTFDWSGSDNVAQIDVIWPTPARFEDGAGWSIGYPDKVVLPVQVTARDAAAPVRLALRIDYAVCEVMCIPAQGAASLTLAAAGASPHAATVAAAIASAPRLTALGATSDAGLAVKAVNVFDGPKPRLVVDIAAPTGAEPLDLFVEGPKGSFFGRPTIKAGDAPGARRLATPILELARDLPRWPLKLTLVAGGKSIEVDTTVFAPAGK